jgi:hypothetical protein
VECPDPTAIRGGNSDQAKNAEDEVETMAEQETGGEKPLTGFADSILSTVRDIATRYIDANAKFAKQMLDFQAQSTSWAKETPLDPIFQSQYSFNQGLIDFWQDAARSLFGIEKAKPQTPDGGL